MSCGRRLLRRHAGWLAASTIAADLATIPLAPDKIAHGRTAVSSRIPNETVPPQDRLEISDPSAGQVFAGTRA